MFEDAMRDCLPHLLDEDPQLLHRLITMVSPNELRARGVPLYRLVHHPGSFVITFPNAYHGGFNAGFNVAEAVNFAPPDWLRHGTKVLSKYAAQRKPATFSYDALLVQLVAAARCVADAARARACSGADAADDSGNGGGGSGEQRGGGIGEAPPPLAGAPSSEWLRRWDDGVTLSDVPQEAVVLAAGELSVRVAQEADARSSAARAGVVAEVRMSGGPDAEGMCAERGVYTDTCDVDCDVCAADLWMSSVVSNEAPGRAVCPAHAAQLGPPPARCMLLIRNSLCELRAMLAAARDCFPCAVDTAVDAAHAHARAQPTVEATKLGPLVELSDLPGIAQRAAARVAARGGRRSAGAGGVAASGGSCMAGRMAGGRTCVAGSPPGGVAAAVARATATAAAAAADAFGGSATSDDSSVTAASAAHRAPAVAASSTGGGGRGVNH